MPESSIAVKKQLLQKFVPEAALSYCHDLWVELGFNLRISKKRNSKLGDYRFDRLSNTHHISVNENLNPFSFLVTYIHEVAHLLTYEKYGGRPKSHGKEWKQSFKRLMLPMLNDSVFPGDVLKVLAAHMKNPKASSTSDPSLYLALKRYDPPTSEIVLSELGEGDKFLFNRRTYKKLEVRRTRSLCLCLDNSRKYLISETAPVRKFKNA